MLAVPSAAAAAGWYNRALGATELWNLGGVVGLEIEGASFFLHEPTGTGFDSPATLGATTVRVEVFSDDPDAFIARAVAAGADRAARAPYGRLPRPAPAGSRLRQAARLLASAG